MRFDLRLEVSLIRYVPRDHKAPTRSPRDLDSRVRPFDPFNAAEKHEGSLFFHAGAERVGAERDTVKHGIARSDGPH